MKRRALDLSSLLDSWLISLRAERKSAETVKAYGNGVRQYLRWCANHDVPPDLSRTSVAGFVAGLLDAGSAAATARSRQLALRRFSAWLVEEGEVVLDPLLGIKAPKLDTQVVEPLTDDELKLMLKVCSGSDLRDRRDNAIIRLMVETGARAGEVVAIDLADVDLVAGTAVVRRGKGGKGGKGRIVPFGPQTAKAIDRYVRTRRSHKLAGTPALWLGDRGKPFRYDGLHKTLKYRATLAGIDGFHPHKLRHTAAHRWLAAGGSEGGLMAVAGWTRPDMLLRYTKARASARAADEARALNLGDL
jgi:integrase/recombinase XerD